MPCRHPIRYQPHQFRKRERPYSRAKRIIDAIVDQAQGFPSRGVVGPKRGELGLGRRRGLQGLHHLGDGQVLRVADEAIAAAGPDLGLQDPT